MTFNLKSRILFSLLSNVFRASLVFVNSIGLARILGPMDYGRISFLLATFLSVRAFFDMFSSSAFFTFLSQRDRSRNFILGYLGYLIFQIIVILSVLLLIPTPWLDLLWKGENRPLVVLSFLAVFMQHSIWNFMSHMAESQRNTFRLQRIQNYVTVILLMCNLVLWKIGRLNIESILLSALVNWSIASLIAFKLFTPVKHNKGVHDNEDLGIKSMFLEFKEYCIPFVPYVIVSFFYDFLDRWFLQNWGGSAEQGFFSIASQFASVSLIVTLSLVKILWKEIAEAHENHNMERVKVLFVKTNKIVFLFSVIISSFFIPWIEDITVGVYGANYSSAILPMTIMFVYPIHQSLGQVIGTMYLALGFTRNYVMIGIVFMLLSILVSYYFLAPRTGHIPGLGLGASGLAFKMVFLQIFSTNVYIWWLSRKLNFQANFIFQVKGFFIFIATGYLSYFLTTVVVSVESIIYKLMFGLGIYLFFTISIIYKSKYFLELRALILSLKHSFYERF